MAELKPTAGDEAAAEAFWKKNLIGRGPDVECSIDDAFLAGILRERERAAQVAEGQVGPEHPNRYQWNNLAAAIRRGPQ